MMCLEIEGMFVCLEVEGASISAGDVSSMRLPHVHPISPSPVLLYQKLVWVKSSHLIAQEKGAGSIKVNGEEVQLGIPNGEAFTQMAAEMAVPLKRVGTPKEAAGAMLLLASPYATFISGQSLEVTGGAFI